MTTQAELSRTTGDDPDGSTLLDDSNAAPASIEAVSVLADDTILAEGLRLDAGAPGTNHIALFANPYSGVEELVYIDSDGVPRWLHNLQGRGAGTAWSSDALDPEMRAAEVVVTCTADNSVDAWISRTGGSGDNSNGILDRWRLTRSADGTVSWVRSGTPPLNNPGDGVPVRLYVQYQGRPSTPVVFAVRDGVMLWIFITSWGKDGVASWAVVRQSGTPLYHGSPADAVTGAFAVNIRDQTPSDITELTRFFVGSDYRLMRQRVGLGGDAKPATPIAATIKQFLGLMSTPQGVGCFFAGGSGIYSSTMTASSAASASYDENVTYELGLGLRHLTVWCDAEERHHVYGVDSSNVLHVFHQTGWQIVKRGPNEFYYPTFESSGQALISRSVFPDVEWATLDRYPDSMPSLQVTHTQNSARRGGTETCALYTQQYNSSDWATEIVRLEQKALRKVTRYQTTVTVRNSFGGPVPGHNVEITTDEPMDLEVNGTLVRPGPAKPVAVPTDFRGKVSIRTVAHGLYTPNVHVTTATMLEGISFNQSADVQKFVAGVGILPTHPDGFTADAVRDAKTSAGGWVFPNLARAAGEPGSAATEAQLTPQEFVTKCAQVFALSDGVALDTLAVEAGDVPRAVHAIATQTWDPTRPAYQVFTSAEELEAHHQAVRDRAGYAGVLDPLYPWFGDVMQGIENGVVTVTDAVIQAGNKLATITVQFASGVTQSFTLVLDAAERAVQYVMSIWSQVQATFHDVVEWMKWAFDFEDVLKTKDALVSGATQGATLLSYLCKKILDSVPAGWFESEAGKVEPLLKQLPDVVGAPTFGADQPLPPLDMADGAAYGTPTGLSGVLDSPHVTWTFDQLLRPGAGGMPPMPPLDDLSPELKACVEKVIAAWDLFYTKFVDVAGEGAEKFLDDLAELFGSLADLGDPQTFAKNFVSALYEFKNDIVDTVFKAGDALVQLVSSLVKAAAECVSLMIALPFKLTAASAFASMWNFAAEELRLETDVVTYGDVLGLAIAYPLTVATKALTGQAPFPDGAPTIPLPKPAGMPTSEPPEMPSYPVPSDAQVPVQVACGISTALLQLFADQYANSRKNNEDFNALIGTAQVLTFLWMDLPVFWGSQNWWDIPSDSVEKYWYFEYMTKAPIYAVDGVLALVGPFIPYEDPSDPTRKYLGHKLLSMLENVFGNLAITYAAIMEAAFSVTLYVKAEPDEVMAGTWLWSQLLGLSSSVTAVERELFDVFPQILWQKRVYDTLGDLSAGAWWFIMALTQLRLQGAVIVTTKEPTPPVVKPLAVVTYEFDALYAPVYGEWSWWVVADDVDKDALAGLEFARLDGSETRVKLEGSIAKAGTYNFTVVAANGYDPAREIQTYPLSLQVKE